MKWRIKKPSNDRCIISECGDYTISRYTCDGKDIYLTHYRGEQIGDGKSSGNEARRVAAKHKAEQEAVA